jgi:hypothetical protein
LAEALAAAETLPTPEVFERIGAHAGWLQRREQAPRLLAAIHSRYARPNLLLTVSQRVLDGFDEPFTDNSPFVEVILDVPTYGKGRLKGNVKAAFVPSEEGAAIQLKLSVVGEADTMSVSGPVRVYSLGHLRLNGSKRVLLTPEGLQIAAAVAKADGDAETKGVATTLRGIFHRIACRIAWRKVGETRELAQREANARAELRLRQRFDARADDDLQELAKGYLDFVRLPLVSRRQFPRRLNMRTTAERMLVEVLQADFDQLAAASAPPALTGQGDLAVRMHESSVNNLAQRLLAGRTLSVNQLAAQIDELLSLADVAATDGEAVGQNSIDDDIEVSLDAKQPLTLRIDDSVVAVTVRGTRFVANGRPYPAMNVTIRYRVELTPEGARLTLAGEPEIIPPRLVGVPGGRLTLTEIPVRRLLLNRLKEDLDQELSTPGVELPGGVLNLGELPIEQLAADDGWLVFSCRVQPRKSSGG